MTRLWGWVILFLIMTLVGFGIGLIIAWGIMPVNVVDTAPATLKQADKDRYRILIAEDYLVTGDEERALARMVLLDDIGALDALIDQINRRAWNLEVEGEALAGLESDLNTTLNDQTKPMVDQPTLYPSEVTNAVSTSLSTPDLISTPYPAGTLTTRSATLTHYVFLNRTPICRDDQAQPVLEIKVVDSSGKPINGIVIIVSSTETTERIITGIKPGRADGIADFLMQTGIKYAIALEGRSGAPEYFTTSDCISPTGESFIGGWSLQIEY